MFYNKAYLGLLIFILCAFNLSAAEVNLFNVNLIVKPNGDSVAFVSLSDIFPLSDHEDSLAIPSLLNENIEQEKNFEYIKLSQPYRKQFLQKTGVKLNDKIFLYDYSLGVSHSFVINDLPVVACLNIYGAEWPYKQDDFMFGFELDRSVLKKFGTYFEHTLVYIGNSSPFVVKKLTSIKWNKIDLKQFPFDINFTYDIRYAGKCLTVSCYEFISDNYHFYLQDLNRYDDHFNAMKRLIVTDKVSLNIIAEKIVYAGESEIFAPMNEQWTGPLLKHKPNVVFGFHWVSFGCPCIKFIDSNSADIVINCDNRH